MQLSYPTVYNIPRFITLTFFFSFLLFWFLYVLINKCNIIQLQNSISLISNNDFVSYAHCVMTLPVLKCQPCVISFTKKNINTFGTIDINQGLILTSLNQGLILKVFIKACNNYFSSLSDPEKWKSPTPLCQLYWNTFKKNNSNIYIYYIEITTLLYPTFPNWKSFKKKYWKSPA